MIRRLRGKRPRSARALVGCALAALSLGAAAPVAAAESSIETETVIPCEGDACQPLPETPEDPTPGTLTPSEGNPPLRFPNAPKERPPRKHKHPKKHRHHGRTSPR